MQTFEPVPVVDGGTVVTQRTYQFDCNKQKGKISSVEFTNQSVRVNVKISYAGINKVIVPGQSASFNGVGFTYRTTVFDIELIDQPGLGVKTPKLIIAYEKFLDQ